MERSVYIIKPEGMPFRLEIQKMIEAAGLVVVDSTTAVLPKWVFTRLYADLVEAHDELWSATLDHLVNKECEVGIVEGENAIKKLFELCGEQTSPLQCRPGTIRSEFGREPPVQAGNKLYWRNVIHRSKSKEEAESDLRIAQTILFPESH